MHMTKLARPVSVSLSQNLIHAIPELESAAGLSLIVDWDELEKQNIPKDTHVDLLLRNIPGGRVIELMLFSAREDRLSCLLDNLDDLLITTRQKATHLVLKDPNRWSFWRAETSPPVVSKESPADITLQELQVPITWIFENNRLWAVLDYIGNMIWRNTFVDWRGLSTVGVTKETRVSGTGEPKPACEVLDTVLGTVSDDLAWRIDDFGIVVISTRDGIKRIFSSADESIDAEADARE